MKKLTNQEAFDIAVARMLVQNKKSTYTIRKPALGTVIECAYRLEKDGEVLHCGVGCLIPKQYYNPLMEGHEVLYVLDHFPVPILADVSETLLKDIQKVHDKGEVKDWADDFILLAKKHNLDDSIVGMILDQEIPEPVIHVEDLVV